MDGDAVGSAVAIPYWVMLIGAAGSRSVLFGRPKLIRLVGEQITKLNPMRAFCVALSADRGPLIVASWFGLPVSSTHIAVGAVFGVGFFREWYTAKSPRRRAYMQRKRERRRAERQLRTSTTPTIAPLDDSGDEEISDVPMSREEIQRRKLVRRAHVTTVVAAWVTTVPASAALSAGVFLLLRTMG